MRSFSIIAGVLLALSLPGCAGGDNLLTEPTTQTTGAETHGTQPAGTSHSTDSPLAFHFKSGDLPLGDFNYEDIKDNLFNPCEEISAEEFAAIGFTTDGRNRRDAVSGINACHLQRSLSSPVSYSVTAGPANLRSVTDQGGLIRSDASVKVPGVYTYRALDPGNPACFASVDTVRGQLGIVVGSLDDDGFFDARCAEAVSILEDLFNS